jgi:predicted AlkP superfamily pyrophosphatase or phosphodiesterase
MSIDQLRSDLLYGYSPVFTGGLRRLLDEGFAFDNATHDHAFTETAPGHHTLSTGVYPSRSGIVANTWWERDGDGWKSVYAVEDSDHPILGYPDLTGRSPANNARTGIADWMLAQDPNTRIVAVSRKDRAAIGLAAQAHGEVYWMADRGGEFITSDYYHDRYPGWVARFNRSEMPGLYAQTEWDSELPPAAAAWTRPDTSRYELDGQHTAFPHLASDLVDADDPRELNHWRYEFTPFPDAAVLAFSEEAIDELELGQRGSVDFLGISLSQTDLVGHNFGPMSREQLDNLVKLDRELGAFFDYLDESVGPGRWVLAFSADHGVLDIPEQLADDGVPAARLGRADRDRFIATIRSVEADGPEAVKRAIEQLPFVAAAYTFDEIESGQAADSFAVLYAHSHSRTRAPQLSARWGVYTRFRENTLIWGSNRATHGSPYRYDRDVPIVFLGAGVAQGRSSEAVATVDLAPTLARLAGITVPDDLDGHVLESALSP